MTNTKDEYKQLYEQVCEQYDVLAKELEATNRQVEILSDALAESRREVAALKAVQEPVAWPVGSAEYHRNLLAMGKAMAKERAREIGDAWNQLANLLTVLEKARSATPPAQIASDDLDRNACEELNCAEEVLDGLSVDLGMEKTDFDCIGDYIKAVFAAQAKCLTPPAKKPQEPWGTYMGHRMTPAGTKEFWGVADAPIPEGTKLYTAAQPAVPEGMVLVPYEPSAEMQEQGSTAAGYNLSQKRARYVYQSMIDMHVLREGAEPTDQWFRIQAGYTTPPAVRSPDHVGYFYFDEGQWKQASDPISFSNCTKLYTAPLYHPITTAPKDGTAILALLRYSDIPMPVRWKDGEWVATWDGYRVSELDGPTHWMSIPEAPTAKAAKDHT